MSMEESTDAVSRENTLVAYNDTINDEDFHGTLAKDTAMIDFHSNTMHLLKILLI